MSSKLTRILHVDDEQYILDAVNASLTPVGNYIIESCNSGQAAIALCNFFRPDLILMDNLMPGLGGIETTRKIRQLPSFARTPIIFLTAKAGASDLKKYEELDAIGIIAKPFDPLTLHQRICLLIGADQPRDEEKLLDVSSLQEFRDIVDEQFPILVKTYLEDGQRYIVEIRSALACGDIAGARMRAHTLKSSSGYLGAVDMKRIAEKIDGLAGDHPIEEAKQIASQLDIVFQKTKEALSRYL